MGLMDRVHTGLKPGPRRCVLYGVQGVGKSTWAASAPSPIFVPTEDGLHTINTASLPVAHSWQDFVTNLASVLSEPHEFRTVIIDSLDWLERLIWADVCAKKGVKNIEDIGYGKGYIFALDQWREMLTMCDYARTDRKMTVILLAHTGVEKFKTPEDPEYNQFAPRLHKAVSPVIREWADEVFFACYASGGDPKKLKGAQPDRIMRCSEGPTHSAKNRLNMPPELPLEYAAYAYYQEQAFAPTPQQPIATEPQS